MPSYQFQGSCLELNLVWAKPFGYCRKEHHGKIGTFLYAVSLAGQEQRQTSHLCFSPPLSFLVQFIHLCIASSVRGFFLPRLNFKQLLVREHLHPFTLSNQIEY